jgi:hypothetical protein
MTDEEHDLMMKSVLASAEKVAELRLPVGSVPERETFWLLERQDGKAWALYTNHSGGFVHSYTEDVWQAGRFQSERHAHDVWRLLDRSERERWKPVEHMFINKMQPLPAPPALTEKRPPSNQEGGK